MTTGYDGLVLAGGRSRRMGRPDKAELVVGGRSMLAAARNALSHAERSVVVGPGGDVLEEPPGGGPVAAIAAGLTRLSAEVVVVLAADLPFVTVDAVQTLADAAPAVALDDRGVPQYLLAAYLSADLHRALPEQPEGASLRSVVEAMAPRAITLDGTPPPWWDCDTPKQLAQARSWT